MNIRKNQARLSTAEKTAFVNAILQLKTATPSQMGLANRYDDYVQIHMDSMMLPDGSDRVPGWAHRGPAFGPWHRALLRNLELDLQDAANDPAITLPYWDWTLNQTAGPAAGSPWTDDFMGQMDASTDIVKSGPFRQGNWVLSVLEAGTNESFLRRALGRGQFQPNQPPFPIATLPTSANVSRGKQEVPYDSAPWARGANPSFRDRLEGWHGPGSIHNRVHLWVGGTMLPSTSPNDPVFFLHHCNIDRIWAQWQQDHTALSHVPAANTPGAPHGHMLTDSMQPWGGPITVQSTLDHHALGYMYDDEMTPADFPAPVAQPIRFPRWQHVPPTHQHAPMRMGMMFDISPEDKAAGGHALR